MLLFTIIMLFLLCIAILVLLSVLNIFVTTDRPISNVHNKEERMETKEDIKSFDDLKKYLGD